MRDRLWLLALAVSAAAVTVATHRAHACVQDPVETFDLVSLSAPALSDEERATEARALGTHLYMLNQRGRPTQVELRDADGQSTLVFEVSR